MRFRVLILAGALVATAGCSSDGGSSATATAPGGGGSTTAAPSTTGPNPDASSTTTTPEQAPKLPDRILAEAIPAASFGTPVDLGGGLTLTLSEPRIAKDDQHPWVEVEVVADLAEGSSATTAPGIELVCAGLAQGGGNLDTDTYAANEALSAGATVKGTAQLVLPGDGGYGDPQRCLDPAYIRVEVPAASGKPVQRRFDVESSLVADINRLVSERQCEISPTSCTG